LGEKHVRARNPAKASLVLAMLLVVYTFNFIDRQILAFWPGRSRPICI
jgi:hypothetical protein